jgi:phospholipid-binding lipoprotein MlaA
VLVRSRGSVGWGGVLFALVVAVYGAAAPFPAAAAAPDPLFDDEATEEGHRFPDPFEPYNRAILRFNGKMDRVLIEPLTRAYSYVVPRAVRQSVRSFFQNLNSPSILVNDVLQREWRDAGVTAARTGINTTVGLAGFLDPAERLGLAHHHSDFGQTLALGGVVSGPYLMMPLLGPTNVRDGFGTIVDFAFRPTTYLFGAGALGSSLPGLGTPTLGDQFVVSGIQGGSTGLVAREAAREQLRALRESSVDFYATLRSAYSQARKGDIWDRREDHRAVIAYAKFIEECQPREPRSSPTGRRRAPRIRRVSSPHCSRIAAAPAR